MSAWYVWSALGFYPVTGGAPVYAVGSPMFEEATIQPVGGDEIVVRAPGASLAGRYIQSATLGSAALDRPWVTHSELLDSGEVSFQMNVSPNEMWGAAPELAPPSMSGHELDAFGCERVPAERIATSLTYVGDTRARGESIRLAAKLTAAGASLSGQTVRFTIAGQTLSATTSSDGTASTIVIVPTHGRSQRVDVEYAGDPRYLPSETTATIRWGR
jgi:hypothetical protein